MKSLFTKTLAVGLFITAFVNAGQVQAAIAVEGSSKKFEESKSIKLVVLDVESIAKNSLVMKHIQNQISKKQAEFQKVIDNQQSELEKESKKLEAKKAVLSEKAFAEEQEKFQTKINNLRSELEKKQSSLRQASLEAMNEVDNKMREIIARISQDKGFDLVVPASQTLFYNDRIDISPEVLRELNKTMVKVEVRFN